MGDEYDELYGGGSGAARAAPPAPQAGAPPPPPPSSSDPYAVLEREQPPGLPPGLSGLANIKQEPGAPPGPPPGGLPPPPGPPQGFHAHDQRAYQAPPGPPPGAPPPYSPHGGAPPHAAPGTAFPPGPPGAPGGFPPPPAPGQDPRSGAPPPPPPADDDDDDVEIHLNTAVVPAGPPGGRGLPGRPPPRLSGYPSRPPPAGGGPQSRSRWGGHMGRGAIAPYSMPEGMGPIHGGGRAYVRTDEFGNAAPVTEEAHAQGDPMNAKFPSKAGPDDWILIPEHQRVEPEEYTEFRELGYGRLYDLDLDRCVMKGGMAGPWLDAAADPGEFFNYGLTKETFQEYQRQVQMFRKTYDLKSDIKLMESDRMISPGDREVPPEARRGGGGPPARPATWGRYVGRGYDAAWLPWTHDLVRRDEEPYVCTILVKSTEDPIEEPPNELALAAAPLTPPQGRGGDHAAGDAPPPPPRGERGDAPDGGAPGAGNPAEDPMSILKAMGLDQETIDSVWASMTQMGVNPAMLGAHQLQLTVQNFLLLQNMDNSESSGDERGSRDRRRRRRSRSRSRSPGSAPRGPPPGMAAAGKACFVCGGPHLARDCPQGGGPKACYVCGGPHLARECTAGRMQERDRDRDRDRDRPPRDRRRSRSRSRSRDRDRGRRERDRERERERDRGSSRRRRSRSRSRDRDGERDRRNRGRSRDRDGGSDRGGSRRR